ncbi:unnamed protein product [Effrenium voratum]|uniref:Uncharacterized protein n=1 Tax=Effrenium voratum TaxID=2562239 RepID=A0AA36HUG3_9DINO|nr:unnamed protein product [Effrenium voratum]
MTKLATTRTVRFAVGLSVTDEDGAFRMLWSAGALWRLGSNAAQNNLRLREDKKWKSSASCCCHNGAML